MVWSVAWALAAVAFLVFGCCQKGKEARKGKPVGARKRSTTEQLKPVSPVVTTLPKTQSDAVTTTTETLKVPPPSPLPSTLTKPKKTEKTQSETKTGAEMEKLEEGVKTAKSFAKGPGDYEETTRDEDTAAVSQDASKHHLPDRKLLNFQPRVRVKHVRKDQLHPHRVDKSRLKSNPERRNHVLATINEEGGHIVNKATHEVDATGQRVINWLYVPPAKERANVAATA